MNSAKIIAIAVDKGGTGKTTTALNLATGLAMRGYKTLAIDADQQCNMTDVFMYGLPNKNLYNAMADENEPLPIYKIKENLDLVPASHELFGVGIELVYNQAKANLTNKPTADCRLILQNKLKEMRDKYDFIIIDCPPSDNILMINSLFAADKVIIVTKPEPFCLQGVVSFGRMLRSIKDGGNSRLGLAGVLINDYTPGSIGHIKGEAALRDWYPEFVYKTHIRHSRPLYNAAAASKDIFTYDPGSNGAADFKAFVEEFITKLKKHV